MSIKILKVEAESLSKAKIQLESKIPEGFELLSSEIVTDGEITKINKKATSIEMALEEAMKGIPSNAEILEKKELNQPLKQLIIIEAFDEDKAKELAKNKVSSDFSIDSIRTLLKGRKGFLRIGSRPNQYEIKLCREAEVLINYKTNAIIHAKVANNDMRNKLEKFIISEIKLTKAEMQIKEKYRDDTKSIALQAVKYQELNDYKSMFPLWRILTYIDPDRAPNWGLCGICLQKMNENAWLKLIPELHEDISKYEINIDSQIENIRKKLPLDNLILAIGYFNKALKIDKNLNMGWYMKAHCLCQLGNIHKDGCTFKRGLECFDEAYRTKPDNVTLSDKKTFEKEYLKLFSISG